MAGPPPLPPRSQSLSRSVSPSASSQTSMTRGRSRKDTTHLMPDDAPPPYSPGPSHLYGSTLGAGAGSDPRSSSMHSLRPVNSASDGRRTLLIIYIHGFLGNETSFRSFPAHVHNLVTLNLAESHVVHTKIYPRYKSRKDISYARDDFSNWLYPHESPSTDVILVGHSLGGILAAEVALLKSNLPKSNDLYQHRILGVIAFDTPFLGMHPSVVKTGIVSLFRSAPDSPKPLLPDTSTESLRSLLSPSTSNSSDLFGPPSDPNYNPSFMNDIFLPQRGKLENALYFWNKHCGDLTQATRSYVTSHFEFGGCLADYPGLRRRYDAMRGLEDVDELRLKQDVNGKLLRRVRFVNYYSASTGRIKENKTINPMINLEMQEMSLQSTSSRDPDCARVSVSPRLSVEEHRDGQIVQKEFEEAQESDISQNEQLADVAPYPMSDNDMASANEALLPNRTQTEQSIVNDDGELPPIPPSPTKPPNFDPSRFLAKDTLKVAQKEHSRLLKAYEQARKDRDRTIKDREKMIKRREKLAEKHRAKGLKLGEQQRRDEQKELSKRNSTLNPEAYEKQIQNDQDEEARTGQPKKKQKDRKFCALPPKDRRTGMRDSVWIRVYLEGIDEVTAHTSLFFMSETYAKLVGDTASRIEKWVQEDATKNALLDQIRQASG